MMSRKQPVERPKLTLVTPEQGQQYINKGREWYVVHGQFSTSASIAIYVVAEYLANQDGRTIYTHTANT